MDLANNRVRKRPGLDDGPGGKKRLAQRGDADSGRPHHGAEQCPVTGKGKPFVGDDPRHRPGPGRSKLEYLESMRSLARDAIEVLRKALQSKNQREALHAAESVPNRT